MTTTETKLVDAADLADALGVHPDTIRRATDRGELPHVRIGRLVRYDVADVMETLARRPACEFATRSRAGVERRG